MFLTGKYWFYFILLIFILFSQTCFCDELQDMNLIDPTYSADAKSSALGACQGAIPTIANGLVTNPALMGSLTGFHSLYTRWNYDKETSRLNNQFYAGSINFERFGTIGFGFSQLKNEQNNFQKSSASDLIYENDSYYLSFGTNILNMVGLGISTCYTDYNYYKQNPEDILPDQNTDNEWSTNLGIIIRSPILRFKSDLIDDELRFGLSFNDLGGDMVENYSRINVIYEISPVVFLLSFNSHIRPFNFLFCHEMIDYQKSQINSWGIEFGVGEIFYYRLGKFDYTDEKRKTHGLGFRLPINILTNEAFPVQIMYDRAVPDVDQSVIHTFRLDLTFTNRLKLPF